MPSRDGISSSTLTLPPSAQHIEGDRVLGPSTFRLAHLEPYAEAARTWLHREAEVIDTTQLTAAQAARQIALAVHP